MRVVRPLSYLDLDPNPTTPDRQARNWRLLRRLLMERPSGPVAGPAAPSALHDTATTYDSVALAWTDNSSDEVGFRLAFSLDGANWVNVGDVGAGVTTCTQTGLLPATTYYYRVRALGDDANSAWSATATVTTPALTWQNAFTAVPTGATRNDTYYAYGFLFTPSVDIRVGKLGRLYLSGNSRNHEVFILRMSDHASLADGTVLAASASDADGFKWVDVPDVVLTAGTRYGIATYEEHGGDTWLDLYTPPLVSVFTDIDAAFTAGGGPLSGGWGDGKAYSTPAMWFEQA